MPRPLSRIHSVVPVGTTVQIPTWAGTSCTFRLGPGLNIIWTVQRDVRYFSPDPDTFWPERWLPDEGPKIAEARGQDFTLVQGAYMPFNYGSCRQSLLWVGVVYLTADLGPGNCVGRSLALHEMRAVIAAVLRRFDLRFAPGFQPDDWLNQLTDHYVLVRGKLEVVLSKRVP